MKRRNALVSNYISNYIMKQIYYFSRGRNDRSGAQIHDMLFAKAYCMKNNYHYVGCPIKSGETKELIRYLKLPNYYNEYIAKTYYNHIELDSKKYKELDSDIFTPYIRKEIISNFNYTSTDIFTITIHIRRGDVNPHKHADRYLYNKYYIKILLQIYTSLYINKCTPTIRINICSESKSYENLNEFKKYFPKCNLYLDTPLKEVYSLAINADIFIMSRSSFSFIPAFYNKKCVIYHPFWHNKLDHWLDSTDTNFNKQLKNAIENILV